MQIQKVFQKQFIKKITKLHVATALLALGMFGIADVSVSQHVQASADESALKKVVLDAFTAPSVLVVVPNVPEDLSVSLPAAAIENSRGQAKKMLTTIYDPSCLTCQNITEGIDKSIAAQTKGQFRALGAGIRDIEWRQVVVNDNSVSVTLAGTLWSKVKFKDETNKTTVVTPTAGFVEIFTLKKVDGNWVITNQVQDDVEAGALAVNQSRTMKNSQAETPPPGLPQPSKGPRVTPFKTK